MCLSFPSDGFKYLLEIGLVSYFTEILLTQYSEAQSLSFSLKSSINYKETFTPTEANPNNVISNFIHNIVITEQLT
jgi:hypothetical protein